MHYGHPDVFDRIFHFTRGGVSKASAGINLSEDIFAGIVSVFLTDRHCILIFVFSSGYVPCYALFWFLCL